jgi:hypothetical protein
MTATTETTSKSGKSAITGFSVAIDTRGINGPCESDQPVAPVQTAKFSTADQNERSLQKQRFCDEIGSRGASMASAMASERATQKARC